MDLDTLRTRIPGPLEPWSHPLARERGVALWVKREDQLGLITPGGDPAFNGNKWRKLKYNLIRAAEEGKTGLITFGGAFSNHLAATAAAGHHFGFRTAGIIRGEEAHPNSITLERAREAGMELHFVPRSAYREKSGSDQIRALLDAYPDYYRIPEGGTNPLALKGVEEMAIEVAGQLGKWPDQVAVSMGTGGTAAGLIKGFSGKHTRVVVFPALKGTWPASAVRSLLGPGGTLSNWETVPAYHFGGYAKWNPRLIRFIHSLETDFGIPLDPVYTAKLFWGVLEELKAGRWPAGTNLVVIHTGGLQGRAGFTQRFGLEF